MSIDKSIMGVEFRQTVNDVWQFDLELTTTNEVMLSVTNITDEPQKFPARQCVLVAGLNWDGGGSITGFDVTDANTAGAATFFGNNHPKHGQYVAFLLSPQSKDDPPISYDAGESTSVTAHIEHVSKPRTLDLKGSGLAGAAYRRRWKVSTA